MIQMCIDMNLKTKGIPTLAEGTAVVILLYLKRDRELHFALHKLFNGRYR